MPIGAVPMLELRPSTHLRVVSTLRGSLVLRHILIELDRNTGTLQQVLLVQLAQLTLTCRLRRRRRRRPRAAMIMSTYMWSLMREHHLASRWYYLVWDENHDRAHAHRRKREARPAQSFYLHQLPLNRQ